MSYWDRKGKYQDIVEDLERLKPTFGYTDNKYFDAYIACSKLYYDAFNNGWCVDKHKERVCKDFAKYVRPILPYSLGKVRKLYEDLGFLERVTDDVVRICSAKMGTGKPIKTVVTYATPDYVLHTSRVPNSRQLTWGSSEFLQDNWHKLGFRGLWDIGVSSEGFTVVDNR